MTRRRFIPLVTKQLKNLPLSAITLTLGSCWNQPVTQMSHMMIHLLNAILSPEKFVKYDYDGIGLTFRYVGFRNPEEAIKICYQGIQPSYHNDCLKGTVKSMLKQEAKTESAFKFCSLSDADFSQSVTKLLECG